MAGVASLGGDQCSSPRRRRRWELCASLMANQSYGGRIILEQGYRSEVNISDLVGLGGGGGRAHGGNGRCPTGERVRVGGGEGVGVMLGVSTAVVVVATNSTPCSALRRPSPPFAVPVLAVPSAGTSWLVSLWVSSPFAALALVVASAGVGVCAALGGAAVVASRTPVACCALASATPGADSTSVGGSGRLVVNILLQVDAFGILVTGCLFCLESCGSMLQVALFLAIFVLIARHKSIGSLSKAPLLMVGWSKFWPSLLFPSSRKPRLVCHSG